MNPRIPRRIQAAWNVLRGQPTAYRTKITGTIHLGPTTVICECVFLPNPQTPEGRP